ncbi:UNVERIFIED_CONTAM: hypothetical protein GTU68_018074 [Idotea baltica]|nr:hypothetical protein [Idotea baltica]
MYLIRLMACLMLILL